MLKRLAVVAIAALVAVGVSGQSNKNPRPNPDPAKQQQPALHAADGEQDQSKSGDDKGKIDSVSQGRNTFFKWHQWMGDSNWWLVIIAGLTGLMIGWQSWETRKAAEAARVSAAGTEKQIMLQVNAVRARIVIEISDMRSSFLLQAKNTGKSAAAIALTTGYTLVLPFGERLPKDPPYLSKPAKNQDFVEWVEVGGKIDIFPVGEGEILVMDLSDPDLRIAIKNCEKTVWAFGRICYRDGITTELRETRFCYEAEVLSTPGNALDTNIRMSGPAIYRLDT